MPWVVRPPRLRSRYWSFVKRDGRVQVEQVHSPVEQMVLDGLAVRHQHVGGAKRVNRTLKRIAGVLRRRWHDDIWVVGRWLGRVVNGWLNYYAVPGSGRFIRGFARSLLRLWHRALRRCSHPLSMSIRTHPRESRLRAGHRQEPARAGGRVAQSSQTETCRKSSSERMPAARLSRSRSMMYRYRASERSLRARKRSRWALSTSSEVRIPT